MYPIGGKVRPDLHPVGRTNMQMVMSQDTFGSKQQNTHLNVAFTLATQSGVHASAPSAWRNLESQVLPQTS